MKTNNVFNKIRTTEQKYYNNHPKQKNKSGRLAPQHEGETLLTFLKRPNRIFPIMAFCFAQVMYDVITDKNVCSDKQPQCILSKDEKPRRGIVPQPN